MRMTLSRFASLAIFLSMVVNMSYATDKSRCEALYEAVISRPDLRTNEEKIQFLRSNGKGCAGTGLYESRLAYFYTEAGNFVEAEKILSLGLRTANNFHKQLKYGLIDLDVKKERLTEAYSKAVKLKEEYPTWYGGYLLLSKITLMQSRFEESIRYATESNKRSPEVSAYIAMAIAYHQMNKDEEAIEAAYAAAKLDSSVLGKGSGINEAIYSLVKLGRHKEAAKLADARIKIDREWTSDKSFSKAYNYLVSKGYLGTHR